MKIEGKFILKVAGTLTAISLVVAALLGATNALTEDKIAAINKANTEVALAAVVSSPDCEFPPIEEIPQAAIDAAKTQSGKLTEAYRVVVNGEDAGYAFKIVAGGSQGDIEMIVGVDADLASRASPWSTPPKRAASARRSSPMRRPPPAPARSISSSASPARARSSSRPTSTPFPARP